MTPSEHNSEATKDELERILQSSARVTVVDAGPGSGKTYAFVSYAQKLVVENKSIAAISYTNAARREILLRTKSPSSHPHFFGTIDSFFLKFVLKPFLPAYGFSVGNLRIVPDYLESGMEIESVQIGPGHGDSASPLEIKIIPGTESDPDYTTKLRGRNYVIPNAYKGLVRSAKENSWRHGLITHSDSHYLTSLLLSDQGFGPEIAKLIATRFDCLLIDEIQDLGHFHLNSFQALVGEERLHCFAVGDPDQAIYQFGGSPTNVITTFMASSGSQGFPLSLSRRCPSSVCTAASHLSRFGRSIAPLNVNKPGELHLAVYNCTSSQILPKIESFLATVGASERTEILVRKNSTIRKIMGTRNRAFNGNSKVMQQIAFACNRFKIGSTSEAIQAMDVGIARALFKTNSPDFTALQDARMSRAKWKRMVKDILLALTELRENETWTDWVRRCRQTIEIRSVDEGLALESGIGRRLATTSAGTAVRQLSISGNPDLEFLSGGGITTVHKAKGLGFPNVVFVVPKPDQNTPCLSTDWFSGSEEQSVAYVAVTRASTRFILFMHTSTYSTFNTEATTFTNLFQVHHIP